MDFQGHLFPNLLEQASRTNNFELRYLYEHHPYHDLDY